MRSSVIVPAVRAAAPMIGAGAHVTYGNRDGTPQIRGTTPEYLAVREWALESGSCFTEQDVRNSSKVCIIGQTPLHDLFRRGSDRKGNPRRQRKHAGGRRIGSQGCEHDQPGPGRHRHCPVDHDQVSGLGKRRFKHGPGGGFLGHRDQLAEESLSQRRAVQLYPA